MLMRLRSPAGTWVLAVSYVAFHQAMHNYTGSVPSGEQCTTAASCTGWSRSASILNQQTCEDPPLQRGVSSKHPQKHRDTKLPHAGRCNLVQQVPHASLYDDCCHMCSSWLDQGLSRGNRMYVCMCAGTVHSHHDHQHRSRHGDECCTEITNRPIKASAAVLETALLAW